jgi:hypothetical protein
MGRFEDIGHDDDFLRNHLLKLNRVRSDLSLLLDLQTSELTGVGVGLTSISVGIVGSRCRIDRCNRRIDWYKRRIEYEEIGNGNNFFEKPACQ